MLKLFVTLQVTALGILATIEDRTVRRRREDGSVSIEHVVYGAAFVAVATGVVLIIKSFVNSKAGQIK